MALWLLVGNLENWERALSDNMWGVKESLKPFYDKLQVDDVTIFYVKLPIGGVIGSGKIVRKFEQQKPFWADEVKSNKVIYPYRFEFRVTYMIPKDSWANNKVNVRDLNVSYRRGMNPVVNKDVAENLLLRLNSMWNIDLIEPTTAIHEKINPVKTMNLHDEIKQKLKEIGEIEGFLSDKEFRIEGYVYDVVWRSPNVVGGAPKYVFEIQVGGNIKHALTNLKHAFDYWSYPKLFLVAEEDQLKKAEQLLGGAFHEIKQNLKLISITKVTELYKIQVEDYKLKKEIGIT